MKFTGRSRELGQLRASLDDRVSRIVRVTGLRGSGTSTLVARVLEDYRSVHVRVPPLPDPTLRKLIAQRIHPLVQDQTEATLDDPPKSWQEIFEVLFALTHGSGRELVFCLDDAHRLGEARSRFLAPMLAAQQAAAAREGTVHIVLVGPETGLPAEHLLTDVDQAFASTIRLGPLPLRAAIPHLPGTKPADRIRAYGVLGGIPAVLAQLDTSLTVGTNVRRLALDPNGPLASAGLDWLERDVQTPNRYVAILDTLARGEADWATVHAGVPDLTQSGQVAPYLKRLVDLGLATTRRSLDAGPRSRSTRYAIADPFLAFWFRFVQPRMYGDDPDSPVRHYSTLIRPRIDDHMRLMFPEICRQHLRHDALESLGAAAREHGGLWASHQELPVAGMLASGAAYYGACRWTPADDAESPLEELERNISETRYGFGRERRLRLVFTGRPAPRSLQREIARHPDAQLIDAATLVGD